LTATRKKLALTPNEFATSLQHSEGLLLGIAADQVYYRIEFLDDIFEALVLIIDDLIRTELPNCVGVTFAGGNHHF
jgi:hypothetical protein